MRNRPVTELEGYPLGRWLEEKAMSRTTDCIDQAQARSPYRVGPEGRAFCVQTAPYAFNTGGEMVEGVKMPPPASIP